MVNACARMTHSIRPNLRFVLKFVSTIWGPLCQVYCSPKFQESCYTVHCRNTNTHSHTVTQCDDINLQELCLVKLSSWLKSGDEIDKLPLPMRLKDQLKDLMAD